MTAFTPMGATNLIDAGDDENKVWAGDGDDVVITGVNSPADFDML